MTSDVFIVQNPLNIREEIYGHKKRVSTTTQLFHVSEEVSCLLGSKVHASCMCCREIMM